MNAERPHPLYLLAMGAVAAAVVAFCFHIASIEWFSRDDFAFLWLVRDPELWNRFDVFLPLDDRYWPLYRPLGFETYFRLCNALFGLDAFGYFAVSLTVHFVSAALVFRLARQLGFEACVALFTALLSVTRLPSMLEIYSASIFHYVGAVFFGLLAATLFLDRATGGGRWASLGATAALTAAILCNEVGVTLPAVFVALSLYADEAPATSAALVRALRRAAPGIAVTAAYLVFRFGILPPANLDAAHVMSLGPHVVRNFGDQLGWIAGGGLGLAVAVCLVALALAGCVARPAERAALRRVNLLLGVWIGAALLPFVLLPEGTTRFSIAAEAPVCLLFGGYLNAAKRAFGGRHSRAFELGMLALLIVSLPFDTFRWRSEVVLGDPPRRLVEFVEAQGSALPPNARLVFLHGLDGMADAQQAGLFRSLAYGGGVFNAAFPERALTLRTLDLRRRPPRETLGPRCIYLVLKPDLGFAPPDPVLLERELPRAVDAPRERMRRAAVPTAAVLSTGTFAATGIQHGSEGGRR